MEKIRLWTKDFFKAHDDNIRKEASRIKPWKRIIILIGLLAGLVLTGISVFISKGCLGTQDELLSSIPQDMSLKMYLVIILIIICLMILLVAGIVSIITVITNFKFYKEVFRYPYHLKKIIQNKKFTQKLLIVPGYLLGLSLIALCVATAAGALWQFILSNLFGINVSSANVFSFKQIKEMNQPIILYLAICFIALIGPVLEEISFRWLYLYILDSFWGRTISVILIIAIFSLAHAYNFAYILAVIPLTCVLTFLIIRTGSLIPCILVHVLNNLITTIILLSK